MSILAWNSVNHSIVMLVPVDRSSLPAGQYRVFITDVTVAESLVLYGFTQAVVVMCVLQRVRRVKVSRR